jgi:hypothetical protein
VYLITAAAFLAAGVSAIIILAVLTPVIAENLISLIAALTASAVTFTERSKR